MQVIANKWQARIEKRRHDNLNVAEYVDILLIGH
jgi:hypothetical protein